MEPSEDAVAFERERDNQAWARWLARMIDALLLQPAYYLLFFALGLAVSFGRLPESMIAFAESPIWSTVIELAIFWLMLSVWDPLFISSAGATPGKWIMGIRVLNADGSKLSFLKELQRTWLVLVFGQALRIPVLSVIAFVVARAELIRDGRTSWDKSLDCRVEHRARSDLLWLAVFAIVIGLNIAISVVSRYYAQE